MICKKCGTDNPDYYIFCQNCFADLTEEDSSAARKAQSKNAETVEKQVYKTPPATKRPQNAAPAAASPEAGRSRTGKSLGNPDEPYLRQPSYDAPKYERKAVKRPVIDRGRHQIDDNDDDLGITASYYDDAEIFDDDFEEIEEPVYTKAPKNRSKKPLAPPEPERVFEEAAPVYADDRFEQYTAPSESQKKKKKPAKAAPAGKKTATNENHNTNMGEGYKILDEPFSDGRLNVSDENLTRAELKKHKQAEREAREMKKLQQNESAEYYDYYDYYDEAALKREKRKSRFSGLIFWLILAVVIIGALVFGYFYATNQYGSIDNAINTLMGKDIEATVHAESKDGVPAHTISFPAKQGDIIEFANPQLSGISEEQRTIKVPGKSVNISLQDSFWIPKEPTIDQETIPVQPEVYILRNNERTKVQVQSYEVAVPQIALVISSPENTENAVLEEPMLTLQGQAYAPTGLSFLRVNGSEINAQVDPASGAFSASIPLVPGPFTLTVSAGAPQYRPNEITINGTVNVGGDGIAAFNEDYSIPVTATQLKIQGLTMPNDTLTVEGAQNLAYDAQTGDFSFTAPLLSVGRHSFLMSLADGKSQTLVLTRIPDATAFYAQAQPLDYDKIVANPSDSLKQSVFFHGTIESITENEDGSSVYTFTLNTDPSKKVTVDYFGVTHPESGESLWIYGDIKSVNAESNNPITIDAYFFYDEATKQSLDQELQALQAAQAPEESEENPE